MNDLEARQQESTDLPTGRAITVADTGAGLLVFAECESHPGNDLVAFAEVDDWRAIREALHARGIGVGATHHLPVVESDELPAPGEALEA